MEIPKECLETCRAVTEEMNPWDLETKEGDRVN